MPDARFPPELVLRSLVTSITNELERGGGHAFIAVPHEAHDVLDTRCLGVEELAAGLGACGALWVQHDIAVSLVCCNPVGTCWVTCDCETCTRAGIGSYHHGWLPAIETYAL